MLIFYFLKPKCFVNIYQVVQEYLHAKRVLTQYGNQESLKGILNDCNSIVDELMKILYSHLRNKDVSVFV